MDNIYCYEGTEVLKNKFNIRNEEYTLPKELNNKYSKYQSAKYEPKKHEIRTENYKNIGYSTENEEGK